MGGTDGRQIPFDLRTGGTGKPGDSSCCASLASAGLLPIGALESAFGSPAPSIRLDVEAKARRAEHVQAGSLSAFEALEEFRTQAPFAIAHTS
jgi:hypothetical protein